MSIFHIKVHVHIESLSYIWSSIAAAAWVTLLKKNAQPPRTRRLNCRLLRIYSDSRTWLATQTPVSWKLMNGVIIA